MDKDFVANSYNQKFF